MDKPTDQVLVHGFRSVRFRGVMDRGGVRIQESDDGIPLASRRVTYDVAVAYRDKLIKEGFRLE